MITVLHEDLSQAVKITAAVAKTVDMSPATSMAFLSSNEGTLRIKATDMSNWLSLSIPADGKDIEPIQVDAFKLAELVSKLPAGGDVKLDVVSGSLKLTAGKSKRTLAGTVTNYPEIPPVEGEAIDIALAPLKDAIAFCIPIVDPAHKMPMLHGVRLEDGHAIGTNGQGFNAAPAPNLAEPITLALGTIKLLKSISSERVSVAYNGRLLSIKWDGGEIVSTTIEGKWGFLVNGVDGFLKTHDHALMVQPSELLRAIAAVDPVAAVDTTTKSNRVHLSLGANGCEVIPKSHTGEAVEPFDAAWEGEDGLAVNFLAVPLRKVLTGFDGDEDVKIGITALPDDPKDAKGCVVRQDSKPGFVAMISQVR